MTWHSRPRFFLFRRLSLAVFGALLSLMVVGTSAFAQQFALGDVLVSIGGGDVRWYKPDGTLVRTLNTGHVSLSTGMAFDKLGNLYVTTFTAGTVTRFDRNGNLLGDFLSGLPTRFVGPESLAFDAAGNLFVGNAATNEIRKYDPAGTLLNTYKVPIQDQGTDWIELASDQKTILYTSEGPTLFSFDTSINSSNPAVTTGLSRGFAMRLLPDGDLLVANTINVVRLRSGRIVQTYTPPAVSLLFAVNLDPDGVHFWTGDLFLGKLYRFNLSSGALDATISTGVVGDGLSVGVAGLAVFGEPTAAATAAEIPNSWACSTGDTSTGCGSFAFPPLPTARDNMAAVAGGDGFIYVLGGDNSSGALDVVERFDLLTGTWTCSIGDANCPASAQILSPLPRRMDTGFGAAVGADGRIYVVDPLGFNAVFVYDPRTNIWNSLPLMPSPRFLDSLAAGPDGRIYVVGGLTAAGVTSEVVAWDPVTSLWSSVAPMPTPRHTLAATVGPDGRIYAIGGADANRNPLNAVEAYDTKTNTWTALPPLPSARFVLGAATGRDGRIYAVGGQGPFITNVVEALDFASGSWWCSIGDANCAPSAQVLEPMPTLRTALAVTAGPDGRIFAFGGFRFPQTNVVEAYSPTPPDSTPPTAIAAGAPTANASGWNNTDVVVTFAASDIPPQSHNAAIFSGVKQISYTMSGAQTGSGVISGSTGSVTISAEGITTLTYFATDNAGNVEAAHSLNIQIDKTPPVVTYTGNAGTYTVDQTVNIACTASDAVSGVASSTCQNISGPAFSFPVGVNTFSATAVDVAGNVGSGATSFTVQVTAASLGTLTTQFVANAGVATALTSISSTIAAAPTRQSKAGALLAYKNAVNAQVGINLTASQAVILIQLAGAL